MQWATRKDAFMLAITDRGRMDILVTLARQLAAFARGARCLPCFVSPMICALLAGCASPAQRIDALANGFGFTRSVEVGVGYSHIAYRNAAPGLADLHVYVDNDGLPWTGRYAVARDPTPDRPVMLELMALDAAPSVYLGRPCYLGLAATAPCTALDWTHERYSLRVVDSMAASLRALLANRPMSRVSIFGHSGGGALAVLLAARLPETVSVVTLGGNLDIVAWARLHGYTELRGSLNPIEQVALAPRIVERHYVGSDDRNVLPSLLHSYQVRHRGALVTELPGLDHDCCWRDAWPGILRRLDTDLAR